MSGQIGFGNRQYAFWAKAPESVMSSPNRGYNTTRLLANGQLIVRRSPYMAQTYNMILKGYDTDLTPWRKVRDGNYGANSLWLMVDPQGLNFGNMLPNNWSQPQGAVGQRGNQAMDFFSLPFTFGAPLSATLNNPNLQALAITGLSGAPAYGSCMWSPNSTAPVWPPAVGTRPFHQMLIPPNYAARITVWGSQNTANSPGLYYAVSNVAPSNVTVPAGTLIKPALAGTSVTIATSASWRVLDLWVGAGSSTTATDYTTFGAMDVRMALTTAPAQPIVFDQGRGTLPLQITTADIAEDVTYVGLTPATTLYQLTMDFSEVAQPW